MWEPGSWGGISRFGVCDAGWAEALLRPRSFALHYLQLLSASAVVEDRTRARHLRGRVAESPRGDGVSSARVCGHAGARASIDERTETWIAVNRVAEIKTAGVAEDAQPDEVRGRGAVTVAVPGRGRTAAGILAGEVL